MSALGDLVNDRVDKLIRFENGEMEMEEVVSLMQELIDDGSAWSLQGSYGRMAAALINAGHCRPPTGN